MSRKERYRLIANSKDKLVLIKEIRNSFEYFDKKANSYIYCNFNFSDVYQYFIKTYELIDIETDKKISHNDSFFRFFGLLQVIYVQQDLTDAIAKVFGVNIENSPNRKINRNLRDQLIGHPLSDERDSNKRNRKQCMENTCKLKSTIILKNITPKTFYYISYEPENIDQQYSEKSENIDSILARHIAFLNDCLDSILEKCFKELERQILKNEEFIGNYLNDKIPEIRKYECWFKQYLNYTSFELDILRFCVNKREEHKKYEVYLVEFKRMIVIGYIEMVDRFEKFTKRLVKTNSIEYDFRPNKSIYSNLKKEKKKLESYFVQSNNHTIGHDLRDISEPYNDLWDIGFNQLSRVFINDIDVINELNNLKIIKSEAIEYDISYRYIRFLVG
jgi:hypothetical protein